MAQYHTKLIVVGRITGVYGIQGWVKVMSYTDPVENILSYTPWQLGPNKIESGPININNSGLQINVVDHFVHYIRNQLFIFSLLDHQHIIGSGF